MKRQTAFFSSRQKPVGLILVLATMAACGGGDSTTTAATAAVPTAPTMGTATPGNGSASIAFTAPSSNGGAAITGYTATCTGGGASKTGSATDSPVSVTGLTNGISYSCVVAATNAIGTGAASGAVSVTPATTSGGTGTSTGTTYGTNTTGGTSGVACSYTYTALNTSASVNTTSTSTWTCNSTSRVLTANGIPDHAVGTFPNPNNPNTITPQSLSVSYPLMPIYSGTTTNLGGPTGATGYVLNGVKIDANTAGSCPANATATSSCSLVGGGTWSIEALGQNTFNFGTDANNAHVQPSGEYHYHGMPEGFIALKGGGPTKMTLIGWAADGFPIYARYGYSTANNASSALKAMTGSYRLKTTLAANRPSAALIPLGAFAQDWEYVAGLGDLDECNGRTGVTPEFPNGIYHYYATDSYPYFQRCIKGNR
jgi:hypothetical protein